MTRYELNLFLEIFPDYCEHFATNEFSLLAKILGVFTVKSGKMDDVHIMLMENALRFRDSKNIKYIFDLKGSTVDRKVKGKTKNTTTLKDVNFIMTAQANKGLTLTKRIVKKELKKALA